jgi:hypothetical protein
MQPQIQNPYSHPSFDPNNPAYPFPVTYDGNAKNEQLEYEPQYWDMDSGDFGSGLTQLQQEELMHSLETDGMEDIQSMIGNIPPRNQ